MKIDVALVSSNDVDMPAAADMDLTTDKLEKLALEVHYLSVYWCGALIIDFSVLLWKNSSLQI